MKSHGFLYNFFTFFLFSIGLFLIFSCNSSIKKEKRLASEFQHILDNPSLLQKDSTIFLTDIIPDLFFKNDSALPAFVYFLDASCSICYNSFFTFLTTRTYMTNTPPVYVLVNSDFKDSFLYYLSEYKKGFSPTGIYPQFCVEEDCPIMLHYQGNLLFFEKINEPLIISSTIFNY